MRMNTLEITSEKGDFFLDANRFGIEHTISGLFMQKCPLPFKFMSHQNEHDRIWLTHVPYKTGPLIELRSKLLRINRAAISSKN